MAAFTFDPTDRSEAGAALAVILALHPDLLTLTRRSDARVVEQPAAPDAAGASSSTAAASPKAPVSSFCLGDRRADGGGPLSPDATVEDPPPVTDAPVTPSNPRAGVDSTAGTETSREEPAASVAGPRRKSPRKKTEPPPAPAPASVEMPPEASDLDW